METISVIIPIYKAEDYVERCLRSIMSQTYSNNLIECILVDDCGPDHSMDIVQRVVNEYQGEIQFRVVKHGKNAGVSEARNSGLRAATGDFILFVDADDYISNDCISALIESSNKYQSDITIGNCYIHTAKIYHHTTKQVIFKNKLEFKRDLYNLLYAAFPWNKLIRRDLIVKNNLFFTKGIIFEDLLWLLQVSDYTNTIIYIPNNTYSYECNPTSIMNGLKKDMNPAAISFLSIIDYSIKLENQECQTEIDLFVFHFIMEALACIRTHKVSSIKSNAVSPYRWKLLHRVLSQHKYLLFIIFLISFRPLWYFTTTRIFRNHRVDWRLKIRDYYLKI